MSASVHAGIPDTPQPGRQTPQDQADPPRTRQTPPDQGRPPGPGQTAAYGLRVAGMHPTGMHSCLHCAVVLSATRCQYGLGGSSSKQV